MLEMLDNTRSPSKIPDNWPDSAVFHPLKGQIRRRKEPYIYPQSDPMSDPCRHPRVQVVSRDEDAEYVECLVCREVFESSEFRDMEIEDKIPAEEE